jgi:hypothetical protein
VPVRDERAYHIRQLRRLRASARRWSVTAAGLVGVTAVVVPYQGLEAWNAIWAGLAGAAVAMAGWRWADHRALAVQPVPDPPDPALAGDRWLATIAQLPGGHGVAEHIRRARTRGALRGSPAAAAWERLERSSRSLQEIAGRLAGPEREAVGEANSVERQLRQLTSQIAGLEEALRHAPAEARRPLQELRDDHLTQLQDGVAAYEQYVVAAAGYLAESERANGRADDALTGLAAATEQLRGVTEGFAELRRLEEQPSRQADTPGTST